MTLPVTVPVLVNAPPSDPGLKVIVPEFVRVLESAPPLKVIEPLIVPELFRESAPLSPWKLVLPMLGPVVTRVSPSEAPLALQRYRNIDSVWSGLDIRVGNAFVGAKPYLGANEAPASRPRTLPSLVI